MLRIVISALITSLMLVVSPVSAQMADDELQLVPMPTELRLSGMAKVVTEIGRPADCLAPVEITWVDGEKAAVSAKSFLIEPGIHRVNGKALLDIEHCPLPDGDLQIVQAADLELEFELGFTYYIGYYHKAPNPEEWKLVVWNIKTNP